LVNGLAGTVDGAHLFIDEETVIDLQGDRDVSVVDLGAVVSKEGVAGTTRGRAAQVVDLVAKIVNAFLKFVHVLRTLDLDNVLTSVRYEDGTGSDNDNHDPSRQK